MRPWLPLLLCSALCQSHSAEVVSEEDRAAVAAVVEALTSAGFPDGAREELHGGELRIAMQVDPATEPMALPGDDSEMQETVSGSNRVIYRFRYTGLHVRRSDGSWLIGLRRRFMPDADDQVDAGAAPVIDVAGLSAAARAAHPFSKADANAWLTGIDPGARESAGTAMELMVPISHHLQLGLDDFAPAIVLLHGAGWSDASIACLSVADQRARNYWQQRMWMNETPIFDPTGAYPTAKAEGEAWKQAHPAPVPEAPAVALRRAIFRWSRGQLMRSDRILDAKTAAAICRTTLDPNDPQQHGARIDALLEAASLPAQPPQQADLATRLASWGPPEQPKMVVRGTNDGAGMQTSFETPPAAYEPVKEDLDALVSLLDDPRPSRFVDFSGPRTIGDNAWRAIATILEADPRSLAGHPIDLPWTADERTRAAAAVATWWKANRQTVLTP